MKTYRMSDKRFSMHVAMVDVTCCYSSSLVSFPIFYLSRFHRPLMVFLWYSILSALLINIHLSEQREVGEIEREGKERGKAKRERRGTERKGDCKVEDGETDQLKT